MLATEIPKASGALSLSLSFKNCENLIDLFIST